MAEELVDPDGDVNTRYSWDFEFQRHIMALLLVDRQFLLQSIDLIKPAYFVNKAHQKACKILFDFFNKHRALPSKVILIQEIKEALRDEKSKLYHVSEITALYDYFEPGLESREYLQDKIAFFAKIQSIRAAFNTCMKMIEKDPESDDTWSQIYDNLRDAMNTDKNYELGLDYFTSVRDRYERMKEEELDVERFVTGWPTIDQSIKGGGYTRGELLSIVGGSGVGKSVALTCIAAVNLLRGKKGVYISLELSEDRVAERFDAILADSPINCLYDSKEKIFRSLEDLVSDRADKQLLYIKQFPPGAADVNTIRAYLAQLKFGGFNPDFVILDYIGEMKDHSGMKIHESRERLVRDLRGLMVEENVFGVTAMQPNRGSKEAQKEGRIDEEHLADSFGQIRPLDGAISLNQNDGEKSVSLGRAFVMKQRSGKSRFAIKIQFDPETLRITEISQERYKAKMTSRSEKVSDEVMIDRIVKEFVPTDENKNKENNGEENE